MRVKFLFTVGSHNPPHLIFILSRGPRPILRHLFLKGHHFIGEHPHAANKQISLCVSVVASPVSSCVLDSGPAVSCVGNSGIRHDVYKFLRNRIKPVHDFIDNFRGKALAFFYNGLLCICQFQNADFSLGILPFQIFQFHFLIVVDSYPA